MNVVELSQRLQVLQEQNASLRQMVNTTRNSRSQQPSQGGQLYRVNTNNTDQYHNSMVDFETKYKKALKEIYEVIQANRSLKEELDKFKTARSKIDGSMSEMRKQQMYKAYENVLQEKNTLNDKLSQVQSENEHYQIEMESLQAQLRTLKDENMQLLQQKQGLQSTKQQSSPLSGDHKPQQAQQFQQRIRQKQQQFHRTIQNYQQHHITLSNQNKRNQQRLSQLQQKLLQSDKQWRQRYQSKQIQSKQIKNTVRHQYQEQINILRKQVNSLKALNTQLMTKLQTNQLEGNKDQVMTEYEVQFMNNIKELRLQMQPLKKQIIQLQEQNHFDKQQLQREKTQLQLKLYQYESTIQHYSITIKNQEEKIIKLNQIHKKNQINQISIKKLQQENKILGGRVIVLESKDITLENRKDNSYRGIEQNVLEFQTRVEMLLDEKQNLANLKNITIHQLVALKAYIAQLDQKLKLAYSENEYATKKYKSYKQKYLNTLKQMKSHQVTQNTLKSKILGYDKLVQRLQSQLQKNVNIGEMQTIQMTTKTTQQQIQIQTFKKKYQSLKQKLILQEKYNKQQLQTIKLNYQTKIVDLTIKMEELDGLRQAIQLYKDKNEQLQVVLSRKDNEIVELRMVMVRTSQGKSQADMLAVNQSREFILSLQQTIRKQQAHIAKCQSQLRILQDSNRKRILTLEKQLHQSQIQINKSKMSTTSTRYSTDRSPQQLQSQNKRFKNRISQLQNEIILTKGRVTQSSSRNNYQLEFKASSLQIEKNQLVNRLETELANRRRLEKQVNQLMMRGGQLEAEVAQLTVQNNRKVQDLMFTLNQKHAIIENLQQQIKRIKQQHRKSSVQLLPHMVTSGIIPSSAIRQDHTLCENKLSRLQRQLQSLRQQNQQLKKRVSETVVVTFNYQIQSIKHEKQQLRLRNQRLEKELMAIKLTVNSLQQQKQEYTRVMNTMKQQISSLKLSHQDQLFDKDRLLTQLRTKLQHSQTIHNNYRQLQQQLQHTINEKQREISSLKIKVNNYQNDFERMNDAINKYNREINTIKYNFQSEHAIYVEQMDSLLDQKSKTLKKYEQQITSLNQQIDQLSQQLSTKAQALIRTQRELSELQLLQDQLSRVNSSLSDRENVIAKNRYELSAYEEENERIKREMGVVKEELQRQRLQVLQKDDELSSVRMQMANLSSRLSNQLKSEFTQQLSEKDHQLTRAAFQLQSLQASYNSIQQQLNQVEFRQRKAQQQLSYLKNQLAHTQQDMNELSQRLMKKQSQVSQITNQMTGLRFLQEEITQKNSMLTKLRAELSTVKIELSQLSDQVEYKQMTILRHSNDLRAVREEVLSRQQTINRKDTQIRNMQLQIQRLKSTIDDNQMTLSQKDTMITKLNGQIAKVKSLKQQLQEELQQRQQQWSNIQYELNQSKSQVNLLADQIQGKDITITKLSNQSAFLKQQITRLNQQLISKSHQINRVSQQVFVQKMQYTNKTSQQVDKLSNQLFMIKRELEVKKNEIEDLQGENRRLRIEWSRVKEVEQQQQQHDTQQQQGMYGEQVVSELHETINSQYRQIMQLRLQLNQRNSQIQLLHEKASNLQQLLHQVQQDNHYNKQHLQSQIQQFIDHQRQLRSKIEYLQISSTTHTLNIAGEEQNTEELKFGLKLYTEQIDRLKMVIDELTEEVTQLKLKLTVYVNQQDRISENLVTMALTFAQVQALRDRMKNKQIEINSVRRSFIQAISSNDDLVSSQLRFKSLTAIANQNNQQQEIHTFDLLELNNQRLFNKDTNQFEVRSDQGSLDLPKEQLDQDYVKEFSAEKQVLNQQQVQQPIVDIVPQQQPIEQNLKQVNLPQPVQLKQLGSQNVIQELNQLKQTASGFDQQQHVSFNPNIIQQPQTRSQEVVQVHRQQQQQIITTQHQQRGRTINIVYQGSQVQSSHAIESQRLVHSQFQSPSGKTYVRVTQQQQQPIISGVQLNTSGHGVYIPQGMNIQPIRQSGASFTHQSRPVSNSMQTQPHLRY